MKRGNLRYNFNRPSAGDVVFKTVFCAAALAIAGGAGYYAVSRLGPVETFRATVTDKARDAKMDSDGNVTSKYLVFTDREVFENVDSLYRRKWNSSDVQGELIRHCTYDLKVYGLRNNFLSMYRNIISAEHVPTELCPTAPKLTRR